MVNLTTIGIILIALVAFYNSYRILLLQKQMKCLTQLDVAKGENGEKTV